MKISVYEATVPTFTRELGNLETILAKAAAHAEAKKIDPAVLVNARLYPDMFPLVRQVQIASDIAKAGAAGQRHAAGIRGQRNLIPGTHHAGAEDGRLPADAEA